MVNLKSVLLSTLLAVLVVGVPAAAATVSTNLSGNTPPAATAPAAAPAAPAVPKPQQDPVQALRAFATQELANFQQAAGAPSEISDLRVSHSTGMALLTFTCPSKKASVTLLAIQTGDGWQPMDMFIPLPLAVLSPTDPEKNKK